MSKQALAIRQFEDAVEAAISARTEGPVVSALRLDEKSAVFDLQGPADSAAFRTVSEKMLNHLDAGGVLIAAPQTTDVKGFTSHKLRFSADNIIKLVDAIASATDADLIQTVKLAKPAENLSETLLSSKNGIDGDVSAIESVLGNALVKKCRHPEKIGVYMRIDTASAQAEIEIRGPHNARFNGPNGHMGLSKADISALSDGAPTFVARFAPVGYEIDHDSPDLKEKTDTYRYKTSLHQLEKTVARLGKEFACNAADQITLQRAALGIKDAFGIITQDRAPS